MTNNEDCAAICPEHNDAFDACTKDPHHEGAHVSPKACRWFSEYGTERMFERWEKDWERSMSRKEKVSSRRKLEDG